MLSSINNLLLKLQLGFAHSRKGATVCNSCWKTATILWVSWAQIICDEYWPRQNSWTTLLRPSGLIFPNYGRMVLVLPAWRGFQQRVRKHRVHRPTLASGRESKQTPNGAHETLHPAGEYISEWVLIKFNLVEHVKLFSQLANAFSNVINFRSC